METYRDHCTGHYICSGLVVIALLIISLICMLEHRAVLYPTLALCIASVYTLFVVPAGYKVKRANTDKLLSYSTKVSYMFFAGFRWLPLGVMLTGATLISLILYLLEVL